MAAAADVLKGSQCHNMKDFERHGGSGAVAAATTAAGSGFERLPSEGQLHFERLLLILACKMNP